MNNLQTFFGASIDAFWFIIMLWHVEMFQDFNKQRRDKHGTDCSNF